MIINGQVVRNNDGNMVIDKFAMAQAIFVLSEGNLVDDCSNVLAKCDSCQYKRICNRIDVAAKETFDDYNKVVKTFDFSNENENKETDSKGGALNE